MIFLTAVANQFRLHKLNKVEKFVMSYGGLRGAVAFALVLLIDPRHVPLQPMFVTTTIAVIYFTVFIQVTEHFFPWKTEITTDPARESKYCSIISANSRCRVSQAASCQRLVKGAA